LGQYNFYETMVAKRQATLNLFSAGLFHLVEQQLTRLCDDASFPLEPPDTKLEAAAGWYRRYFRLDPKELRSWAKIDELRLLANAVKHAEGSAARQLRERRPDLFEHPRLRKHWPDAPEIQRPVRQPLAGGDLYVTDKHFADYASAAVDFFHALAEYFEQHGDDAYPEP
jgi:hypothetical protein